MPPLTLSKYGKPAKTPAELLAHLEERGLAVPDRPEALQVLGSVGYFRLLIYMRALQGPSKVFHPGTSFGSVMALYRFDRALRLLCLDAMEQIEVALRAAIISELAVPHGPHFYLSPEHFESASIYRGFVNKAVQADYLAIRHYQKRYNDPPYAPIWAICEAVTFGALSHFYSGLTTANRKRVARKFDLGERVLVSWFRTLSDLRNICAHHNRLWNAVMAVNKPVLGKVVRNEMTETAQDKFYGRAVIVVALLERIDSAADWKSRLKSLIKAYPAIPAQEMGFPDDWLARTFWE